MNFTREPILETIISAKEGYKLSLKSSKHGNQEEYLVDAIEVVSYGASFFYRYQERPKAFFLPVSDYEIFEVRETKLIIKNPNLKESIKIGGGKESSKSSKADKEKDKEEEEPKAEQKRERKKYRRTKRASEAEKPAAPNAKTETNKKVEKAPVAEKEAKVSSPDEGQKESVFSHLLRPPESLISDSIQKYKRSEDIPSAPVISGELNTRIESSSEISILVPPQEAGAIMKGVVDAVSDPELTSEPPVNPLVDKPSDSLIKEEGLQEGENSSAPKEKDVKAEEKKPATRKTRALQKAGVVKTSSVDDET